ncbi:MAG TPA: tRNA pseudouridine(55) synthase TruB [Candidatus Saccharimonadales bacterium]|nr:tRNA pseudouridine(55) synthase TruB [Candidatus Saccharimonadales bacterium]
MQGILLVDKPKTWTSFDVVNYVRRMVATAEGKKPRNTKVGHTGTLDPLATGLLVLLVGKEYTRRATELTKLDKTYEVVMKLGETSSTGDEEGEKTAVSTTIPSQEAVLGALESLQGHIMQVPPAFSAMKINGQRAYKLAREGKAVALEARPVTIYKNTLISYDYPLVRFSSEVGSGTYIRSLVEDLGKLLGTGAYMADLRRTRVGMFAITDAAAPTAEGLLERIKPLANR